MGKIRILLSGGRYSPPTRWATRSTAGLLGSRCFFTLIGRWVVGTGERVPQ